MDIDIFSDLHCCSERIQAVYQQAIDDYHSVNKIDHPICNPFPAGQVQHLLYLKCWIDTVQWHVEDEIRHPQIDAAYALGLKRRIDQLNQDRTNKVELIDSYVYTKYKQVHPLPAARINSESPAWALDRQAILALKIYHMREEVARADASVEHRQKCAGRLAVLLEQQRDLLQSINELLQDISCGRKIMRVYRQMKMYNDPEMNPVLYNPFK
jgi:hypothetical protein